MLHLPQTLCLAKLEDNMVFVEGGIFERGEGAEWHKVKLSDFEICRFPVSQQLWMEVMGENPEKLWFQNPHRPVEGVSWEDITNDFLPALREKTGITAYCLPTEAQWEYAARDGQYGDHRHTYAGSDYLKEVAWYDENSHEETQPLALKQPNYLGLYGMSGNVWEWCQDNYDRKYYQQLKDQYVAQPNPDPEGPESGNTKVVRGGSWLNYVDFSRVVARGYNFRFGKNRHFGFRLCRYLSG